MWHRVSRVFFANRASKPREKNRNDDGGLYITREREIKRKRKREIAKFAGKCSLISTPHSAKKASASETVGREKESEERRHLNNYRFETRGAARRRRRPHLFLIIN